MDYFAEDTELLGQGSFGQVYKGLFRSRHAVAIKEVCRVCSVCVCVCVPRFLAKSLSLIAPPLVPQLRKNEDIDIMMQEAVVLASLKHPNIVSLVGVVTLGAPTLVVMEMLERGSLCKSNPWRFWAFVLCLCAVLVCCARVLRARPKHPPPPSFSPSVKYLRDRSGKHVADTMGRIRFCSEISSALAYLAEQDITHRDVATRNILLSANFVCKLGDFGLARHLSHNGTCEFQPRVSQTNGRRSSSPSNRPLAFSFVLPFSPK